jgi:2-polyprenyl-6-methoxyphenol hydroxylase-like FAD-dependent oxidoreductase
MTYDRDVLIVGAGPVGLTLALLLASYGHKVTVLERHSAVYSLPRAVCLSHDNLRIYDGLGLHDALFESEAVTDIRGTVSDDCEIVGVGGKVVTRVSYNGPSKSGTSLVFRIHQPAFEEVLATACADRGVDVIRSTEVENVVDMGTHVELRAKGPDGEVRKWSAPFVAGCDGANSIVRRCMEIPFTDCPGPKTRWLVVDVKPKIEGAAEKWKDFHVARSYMDAVRPRASIYGTKHRRRWEFMLMTEEEKKKASDPDFIWSLLAEFDCTPETAYIDKTAAYNFKGGWCEAFNKGRVVLAGDAAHITPPFLGQGLNSGIRDVNSLSWRLDLALRYPQSRWRKVFQDWSVERLGGVTQLIRTSVGIETQSTTTDMEKAMMRDKQLAENTASPQLDPEQIGSPGTYIPQSEADAVSSKALGSLFVDGTISIEDKQARLCDHFGTQGWLILKSSRGNSTRNVPMSAEAAALFSTIFRGKVLAFDQNNVQDVTGVFSKWFEQYDATGVLLRPDHYVFGVAKSAADFERLVLRAAQHVEPVDQLSSPNLTKTRTVPVVAGNGFLRVN